MANEGDTVTVLLWADYRGYNNHISTDYPEDFLVKTFWIEMMVTIGFIAAAYLNPSLWLMALGIFTIMAIRWLALLTPFTDSDSRQSLN